MPAQLTVREVAHRYGVHVHMVREWIKNRELDAVNVSRSPSGRKPRWRIPEDAIAEFEKRRTPRIRRTQRRREAVK